MMGTTLHWVEGPWPGRLAMAARPRGGEWLDDEIRLWRQCSIDTVVSLLEPAEEAELDLSSERISVLAHGMTFRSLPITDRQVPEHERELSQMIDALDAELAAGRNVVLHCRQGVGRTGLVAACLLMARGADPIKALDRLSRARGITVPETAEQRKWIDQHAEMFVAAR